MNAQSINTLRPLHSTENGQRVAAHPIASGSIPLAPSWRAMGNAQKDLQPAVGNPLQQALLRPTSLSSGDPGDNSHLSVEQVIQLVDLARPLKAKWRILEAYISARAAALFAQDVVRLADHLKAAEGWSEEEQNVHDLLFADYLTRRDYKLDPESMVLLANESFKRGVFDDSIKTYMDKNIQKPELGYEHVVALVKAIPTLDTRDFILRSFLWQRGAELSGEAAIVLAEALQISGEWLEDEQIYRDAMLMLWVRAAIKADTLSFSDLLKVASNTFDKFISNQMLFEYVEART